MQWTVEATVTQGGVAGASGGTRCLPIIPSGRPGSPSDGRFGFALQGGRGQLTDYGVALVRAGWEY